MSRPGLSVALFTSARTWRGSSVSFAAIAEGLRDAGHRVRMLAGDESVAQGFARLGLPSSRVPIGNTGFREAWALAAALKKERVDAILVDRPRDLRVSALASLTHPLAIVNCYNLSRARPPLDLLSHLAYRRVGLTIFVSRTSAARVLGLAGYIRRRPHRVIHHAVDSERFRPDPAAAAAFRGAHGLGDAPFALAVGSLTLDKRYDFVLGVWERLGAAAPPLLVCGEGVHGERLRGRARELGVDVRFVGHLGPDALPGGYAAATCFVHAGAVETFGLSVLEAMASGTAVLGVDAGAVPEVLGNTGVLVPPDDAAGFGAGLRALVADPRRRQALGCAARNRALELFSPERMRASYVAAIEAVCAACASRS